MEGGDPLDRQDVKRIRLEPHHYSDPPRPGQPHSTPRPQHPQNPHDLHQPRPYQPSHQSGPQPPPRNHPHQPQPYPSGYRESTIPPHENRPPLPPTDYRQLPPPVTGVSESNQHAFHNSRSGSSSSAPMNPNKPWQAHEAGYSRPPSNPLQPSPSDPPRPLTLTTNIHEQNRPMEHGHHSMYPSTEHHPNGLPPNGFHSSAPHEAYGGPPVGPNQSYMSTPLTPYPPTPFGPGPQAYTLGARKKTVRAQQACNTCRSRKQKCNEARPCDFCKENNLECEYKEVPPPKQDRTMMRMIETLGEISKKLDTSTERLNKRLDNLEHRLGQRGILSGEAIEPPAIINEPSPTVDETLDPDSIPTGDHREDSKDDTESIEQQRFKRDPEPPPSYDHHVEHRHTHNRSDDTDIIRFPADHTTAAHQLMNSWPHIRQYCRDAGIFSDSYVMEVEEGRGLLRLYGWGEGDDKGDTGHQTASSPAHSAHSDETSVGASPPAEGLWGYGYPSPSSTESRRSSDLSSGDLTPEGTLKLDARIVNRLVNAYINNIHILHPFLDTAGLNKMIDGFVSRYGTGSSHVKSPGFAVPSSPAGASSEYHGGAPLKRKRSEGPIGGYMMSDSPKKPAPERSITSAICLLVLALGRACEVKQPLPGPSPEYISTSFGSSPGAVQTESPPATVRPSPASSHSTLASITSPNQEPPRFISRSRRSSVEGISKPERRDYSYGQRNMDVIPGLAYYAQAAAILGELHGGNDISHAHGFLLAGLYMGQFARVMESWSWINAACRVCNILVEKDKTELSKFDRNPRPQRSRGVSRRNLIKFAFWTALQLESDIRAELSNLPRSGIHDHEEDVTYPSQLYEDGAAYPKVETDQMLFHYSTQIHLRKAINKVHARLYDKRVSGMPLQVDEAFTLSDQLDNWRRLLNANVQWDDNDPPPGGINDARLRAKYYGGKYVATRAILRHAIYEMEEKPHLLQRFLEDPDALPVPESYTQGKPLTRDEQDLMIIRKCSECIQCAIRSTIAFDGCQSRIVVTNIFGTAHAQFGNMLVLTATWHSWLGALVDPDRLEKLNARTISFLSDLVPISPTMRKNILILKELEKYFHEGKAPPIIHSTHSSFNANMG